MLGKCSVLPYDGPVAPTAAHLDIWSLRSATAPTVPLPVLRSVSAFQGISSVRYGPPAVVAVAGQLEPLVHGRAGLPRQPPQPSPPLSGDTGGLGGGDDDVELLHRRRSHALASTSTATGSSAASGSWDFFDDAAAWDDSSTAAEADAAHGWARPSRHALLRMDRQLTPAQAAVRLLRIAEVAHPHPLVDERKCRAAAAEPDVAPPLGDKPLTGDARRTKSAGQGPGSRQPQPAAAASVEPVSANERGLDGGPQSTEPGDLERSLASDPLQQERWQQQEQQGRGQQQQQQQQKSDQQQQQRVRAAAVSRPYPPLELLAGLDRLALCEALEVLQPLLPGLSATQLQRCLETLAAVRHTPADPWFHDWLLASEQLLRRRCADATEVYGMLVAMRVLRLRPRSAEWVGGAVAALVTHLPQLDALQVVELLGCFADMALRPPDDLLARAFVLLLPDLPHLQPRVVLDLLCSCSRLRVPPPPHLLAAAAGALTPAALAAAPPAQLCRLAASAAALRLQLPLGLLTALVARVDGLLRSDVAAAGGGGDGAQGGLGQGGAAGFTGGSGDAAGAAGALSLLGPVSAAGAAAAGDAPGARTLQPRRGKARRTGGATVSVSATPTAAAAVENSPSASGPWARSAAAATSLTTPQLSCLLRDLRLLQAPLPPDWGELCGRFLVAQTDAATTPVVQVSYLLRSVSRCGLALPPVALRVVTARLEASLCTARQQRRRLWQRQREQLQQQGEESGTKLGGGSGGRGSAEDELEASLDSQESQQWTPQALSTTIAALAPYAAHLQPSLLAALYDSLYDTLERFDLPELTATLHALSLLAAPPPRQRRAAAAGSSGPAAAAEPPPPPPAALVMSYLSCLHGRMHRIQPWQASMCIFALLRLRARPEPAWMDAFLGQVYGKLPYMNEIQIASVAWVVAKMSYRPCGGWIERLLGAAAGRLSCFSPRHLTQLLWAVGRMGHRPSGAWMARWLDKARGHFRTCDGRTLAAMVWAVAAAGHRPDDAWLQDFCKHFARRLQYASPRAVANTLAALAALGHRPDPAWLAAIGGHVRARLTTTSMAPSPPLSPGAASALAAPGSSQHLAAPSTPAEGGCYSLHDLSHVCYSFARLRYSPSDDWLDAVTTNAGHLALMDPTSRTAPHGGGHHVSGHRHHLGNDDDDDATDAAAAAAAAAHAKHIALLVLALARLRRRPPPPPAWSALLEGLYPCLPYASPQALSVLLAAAAALRLTLPREHAGALLLATHRRMGAFSGRGLALMFRGFVELGVDPGARWLGRLEEVLLMQRQEEQELEQRRQNAQACAEETGAEGRGDEAEPLEEEEQQQQQQEPLWGSGRLTAGERSSMLWAAVTLETARLEKPDEATDPFAARHKVHHRQELQQAQQQQQQQEPLRTPGAERHAPPPPRWVRKPGPLLRPLRLAGLIALLLPYAPAPAPTPNACHDCGRGARATRTHSGSAGPGSGGSSGGDNGDGGGDIARRRLSALSGHSGQDLALVCWALGRLRVRPRGLLSALLSEVWERLAASAAEGTRAQNATAASAAGAVDSVAPSPAAAAIASSLAPPGSAARAGLPRPDGAERLAPASTAASAAAAAGGPGRGLAPQQMAMAFWGLSSVGVWPSTAWQATAAAAALRAARDGGLAPRDITTVLLALARWRREPRARQQGASRLGRPLSQRLRLASRRRSRLRQGQDADAAVGTSTGETGRRRHKLADSRLRACTAALAQIALADSAAHMPPGAVTAAATPGSGDVPAEARRCYDARTLATLAWALANVGVVRRLPDAWVAAFMPVSLRLLSQLPPSHRVTVLDSLSRLGLRPGQAWMDRAEQVVMEGGLALASSYRGLDAALRRMAGNGTRQPPAISD